LRVACGGLRAPGWPAAGFAHRAGLRRASRTGLATRQGDSEGRPS